MSFGELMYAIVLGLFIFMTFGIIKNYYKSKFDEDGHRIDMYENNEEKKS